MQCGYNYYYGWSIDTRRKAGVSKLVFRVILLAASVMIVSVSVLVFNTIKSTPPPPQPQPLNPGCISRSLSKYEPVATFPLSYEHPSVVQYAKLSKSGKPVSLTFMDYIAVMSTHKFIKPETIIIHTYSDIQGRYWELIKKWNDTSVKVNKVQRKATVGGKKLQYITDFVKIRGLLEFGGVISDFDVIIVNGTKLKSKQRIAECVLSRENHVVNAGFNSCIKNSSFVRKWLEGYHKDYRPLWLYNASEYPRNILESNTSKVCYNMYQDPNIAVNPTWRYAERDWLKPDGVKWRVKMAAHYFNKNLKNWNETSLERNKTNSFKEIIQYVLEA